MRSKTKWFAIGLAVCVMLTTGMQEPAKAGYVQSGPYAWTSEDNPADSKTSTMEEQSDVDTYALDDEGYCYCYVHTKSWATATDSASVDAYGYAYWQISWQWQGPPSTPPGGTLSWYIDAWGHATASGHNDPGDDGSAYSDADGSSGAWIARNVAGNFFGSAWARGNVLDEEYADGRWDIYGEAEWNGDPWSWELDYGSYDLSVGWKLYASDSDDVASGTSQVQVLAGAACDGSTLAYAVSEGSEQWEAVANTWTNATAWVNATLE